MNCSLIICTYNWPEALSLVLSSAIEQSISPDEIIVADDGSDMTTALLVDKFSKHSSIPIMHSWQVDDGCRIPHSRNKAIAKSNYEYIIMVDGDTVLHKDFVKDHLRFSNKGVYIQGSRVLLQEKFTNNLIQSKLFTSPEFFSVDSKNKLNMLRLPILSWVMSFLKSQNIRRIRGCNYSLFKKDIIKVNGFNEEITTWGREDSEFVQRLFNVGLKKQHLKFSGIQYHLYHNERVFNSQEIAAANNYILENTISNNLKRCSLGIDNYL